MSSWKLAVSKHAAAAMSAAALAALAAAGCGSSGDSSRTATTTAAATPPQAATVTIAAFKYRPATVTVRAGTRLVFDNSDDAAHTATADDGAFDSGSIAIGKSRKVTLARAGTFAYHCDFHPFMHGTVVVR